MCTYTCACMHACMHTHRHTQRPKDTHANTHTHTHTHTLDYVCIIYVCMCMMGIHTYTHKYTPQQGRIHTIFLDLYVSYTCGRVTYIHIHIHIHTSFLSRLVWIMRFGKCDIHIHIYKQICTPTREKRPDTNFLDLWMSPKVLSLCEFVWVLSLCVCVCVCVCVLSYLLN